MLSYPQVALNRLPDPEQAPCQPCRSVRARCKVAEGKEKEIHRSACEVPNRRPVLPPAALCPVETGMCNHRREQDFHL